MVARFRQRSRLRRRFNQIPRDRKSTRLNSSHQIISYAVFCLKKKNIGDQQRASQRLVLLRVEDAQGQIVLRVELGYLSPDHEARRIASALAGVHIATVPSAV